MRNRIGVCSWSLQPADAADLVRKIQAAGVSVVQLALDPLRSGSWSQAEIAAALPEAGITIASGMMGMRGEDYSTLESIKQTGGVRLDEHWPANLSAARRNAQIARELGISLVTFHAGFLPHERHEPLRAVMVQRLHAVVQTFADCGVRVAFETGQETADTLLGVLDEFTDPPVGVNFDPANMLLYGAGDPVAALRQLAPHVTQVHVKDAVPTSVPGAWGTEVPVGRGQVDWPAFFRVIREADLHCDLIIEREAGDDRIADVLRARQLIAQLS